jgi:methionine sulfoxide reductase catalytic subunit
MLIKRRIGWELPESAATPEHVFLNRRQAVAGLGLAGLGIAGLGLTGSSAFAQESDPSSGLYPAPRNTKYTIERDITPEVVNANYNNFYEFGTTKNVTAAARSLKTRPWSVQFDGLVEQPMTLGIDDLLKRVTIEERLYRHRCVEGWSMTVPWSGFPVSELLKIAKPLGSAKYVRFETFLDPKMAPGQRQSFYPWAYSDAITMAEAANELAFMVTGAYGKTLGKTFGAPIRLALPWKYGFKHVKSVVKVTFTEKRPISFWQSVQSAEYGFWANVNPAVAHPRWSQATEEVIGTGGTRLPTQIFNGYADYVADLYKGLENERLWA